jgi:ankyrin repeat protein
LISLCVSGYEAYRHYEAQKIEESPLDIAVAKNNIVLAAALKSAGAILNHLDAKREARIAIQRDNVPRLQTLVRSNLINVNTKITIVRHRAASEQPDVVSVPVILLAAQINRAECVRALGFCDRSDTCETGDTPHFSDVIDETTGRNVYHLAAKRGSTEVLQVLHEDFTSLWKRKVDEVDKSGLTPLHLAARAGQKETCQFLISNGADLYATTPRPTWKTPLELAHKDCISIITEGMHAQECNVCRVEKTAKIRLLQKNIVSE